MTHFNLTTARGLDRRFGAVAAAVLGLALLGLSLFVDTGPLRGVLVVAASAVSAMSLVALVSELVGTTSAARQVHDEIPLEDLPVAVLSLDRQGRILRLNQTARSLLGAKAVRGKSFASLVTGLGRSPHDWLAQAVKGHGLGKAEVVRVARPDHDIFVQVVLDKAEFNGRKQLIAVMNDATELKTLEAQFVQSQKMQAIGQLAGGVAHDFNNLLTAISGHCDLLLLRHDPSDQDFGELQQIHQNANRAAGLVEQLLAFSRKQNLRPERLDLHEVLSDLTHLLNRLVGEPVNLEFSYGIDVDPVRADKRQLEQVVMNLVVNARDALNGTGGVITVATKNTSLAKPLRRSRATVPAGRYVSIFVTDDGCGISPDHISQIFEPFYTTKKTGEGTGLGLSTVYGIVKQTGGFVFVSSEPGQGTAFEIMLPSYQGPAEPAIRPENRPAPQCPVAADARILLVEDEGPVRAFASRALRLRGYHVIEAANAEEALEHLADPALCVDLFLTDVIMPGLDGPGWVRKALKTRPDARTIFMSGYAEESFEIDQAEVPNSIFLAKPFSLSALTDAVHRILEPAQQDNIDK